MPYMERNMYISFKGSYFTVVEICLKNNILQQLENTY